MLTDSELQIGDKLVYNRQIKGSVHRQGEIGRIIMQREGKLCVFQVVGKDINGRTILQRVEGRYGPYVPDNINAYSRYVEPKPEPPLTDEQLAYVLSKILKAWVDPSNSFRDTLSKMITKLESNLS